MASASGRRAAIDALRSTSSATSPVDHRLERGVEVAQLADERLGRSPCAGPAGDDLDDGRAGRGQRAVDVDAGDVVAGLDRGDPGRRAPGRPASPSRGPRSDRPPPPGSARGPPPAGGRPTTGAASGRRGSRSGRGGTAARRRRGRRRRRCTTGTAHGAGPTRRCARTRRAASAARPGGCDGRRAPAGPAAGSGRRARRRARRRCRRRPASAARWSRTRAARTARRRRSARSSRRSVRRWRSCGRWLGGDRPPPVARSSRNRLIMIRP